jgi:hypothetical protein
MIPTWMQGIGIRQKAIQENLEKQNKKKEFLSGYLETMPQAVYSNWISGFGSQMSNYYSRLFGDFWNEYQGTQAGLVNKQRADAGTSLIPQTSTFEDFLKGIDLNQRYGNLTSRMKGFYHPAAAPGTRILNY